MKTLKSFVSILDHQTVIITVLALSVTYLCNRFNLAGDMPSGLVGVAVIFPIVFSINAAYRRREDALKYLASIKGHSAGLYWAHRDWTPAGKPDQTERGRKLLQDLMSSFVPYFRAPKAQNQAEAARIYELFSAISKSHESMREIGVPANEVSRANQYLRAIVIDFERLRNIRLYRTPVALRSYSRVFLNVFPIIFGPYFAQLCQKHYPAIGYLVAILYSLVLVSLDNIQENLENPFDGVGEDDINLDMSEDYRKVFDQ